MRIPTLAPTLLAVGLFLSLLALTPRPATACPAECEAWLCLPGGFAPSECAPAKVAVEQRLARGQEPLPPWSSCRARCGNAGAANLRWTFPTELSCPHGGSLSVGLCRGIDDDGCSFTYTPRNHGEVWVHVDGQRMDARFEAHSLPYTLAAAGARQVDRSTCPDIDPGDPPLVVGPPVGGGSVGGVGGGVGAAPCNTIACPHVQHGWGADVDLLNVHWTLRAAPHTDGVQ